MTEPASPLPRPAAPDVAGLDVVPGVDGIDREDTEVVPAALLGMVTSVRTTYRAMQANGCYPAIMAVGAVEDTVAALARLSGHLELYVGDYSGRGGTAVVRASELPGQTRSALSDARHHLALDDMARPTATPPNMVHRTDRLTASVQGARRSAPAEPATTS